MRSWEKIPLPDGELQGAFAYAFRVKLADYWTEQDGLDLERFKREVLGVPGLEDEELYGYIQYRLGLDAAEVFIAIEEYYGTQLALRQVYRVN